MRILDLFIDLPKEQENSYLAQHLEKLDKDFAYLTKASKTRDILAKSIENMNTMRLKEERAKLLKK
jgi:hypothetical protein